jgi:peptide/nickel transport system permease protein
VRRNPFFRELRSSAIARFAVLVTGLYLVVALFGPLLAPYDATAITTLPRQAPSAEHWFGTDEIGRDTLSRLLVGARTALLVGTIAVSIGLGVGGMIGIVAAYFGGWLDSVLMRVVDVLLAFPGLLLALAVITFLGPGLVNTMIAIGIGGIPGYARLMRGEVLSLLERDFISAARALGAGDVRVMGRHLVPLSISPLLV